MKVAIYGRQLNEDAINDFKRVYDCFLEHDVEPIIYSKFKECLQGKVEMGANAQEFSTLDDIRNKADIMVSLGGDGTFLDAAALLQDSGIPIIGINFGRLGFLASIGKDEINKAIQGVINRDYSIETRTLLAIETEKKHFGDSNYALNDIIIQKRDNAAMMIVHVYVNSVFLNSYWADGLVVSTPTGSTAYSLSCGGPIVHPKCSNIVITPISPHNLNVRPMVLSNNITIDIEVECRNDKYLVSCDSRSATLRTSEKIAIQQAPFLLNIVRLKNESYFATLRSKMMWGLDRRN